MTSSPAAIPDYAAPRPRGSWLTQTAALAADAYRQVNAQKLFWITMTLNLLAVAVFAIPGIDAQGVSFPFGLRLDVGLTTDVMDPGTFYKYLYTAWAIPIWLTWVAVVLALISTANIFPDLLNAGAIDLYLSKPMGRLRLFFTKYLFGLTFAALQVAVFSAASFLAIGLRGGTWVPGLFWAVPILTLYFSFLYCVSALLGVLFRSTLAAMLLTLLLWFGLFIVNATERSLLTFQTIGDQEAAANARLVERNDAEIEETAARSAADGIDRQTIIDTLRLSTDDQKRAMAIRAENLAKVKIAHRIAAAVKAPLPKTDDTAGLMHRWLVGSADLPELPTGDPAPRASRRHPDGPAMVRLEPDSPSVEHAVREELDGRSVAWTLGTSCGFEAVILALAAWVFARRDY